MFYYDNTLMRRKQQFNITAEIKIVYSKNLA